MEAVRLAAEPALQRVAAAARLCIDGDGLRDLYQSGSARFRFPRMRGSRVEAALINTAGGLTGGDRFEVSVTVARGGDLTFCTPACERIYRSLTGDATIALDIRVEAGARLDWLPQETILYSGARLDRSLTIDLSPMAQLLAVETVIFGRTAMGEKIDRLDLVDRWRVSSAGRPLYADATVINDPAALVSPASLAGAVACTTLLAAGPDLPNLDDLRALLPSPDGPVIGGASLIEPGLLTVRLVARDSAALRQVLTPMIIACRGGRALPRLWIL